MIFYRSNDGYWLPLECALSNTRPTENSIDYLDVFKPDEFK